MVDINIDVTRVMACPYCNTKFVNRIWKTDRLRCRECGKDACTLCAEIPLAPMKICQSCFECFEEQSPTPIARIKAFLNANFDQITTVADAEYWLALLKESHGDSTSEQVKANTQVAMGALNTRQTGRNRIRPA